MFNNKIHDTNHTRGLPLNRTPNTVGIAAFNMETIHQLLDSKGVVAFHIKHALDPKSQTSISGNDPSAEDINFLFYGIRPIRVVPTSMDAQTMLMQQSLETLGTQVLMNIGGYYLDNHTEERVIVRPNDLIVMNPTITIGNQQAQEVTGKEVKLPQYVSEVDFAVDESGNEYVSGRDFDIHEGVIFFKNHPPEKRFSFVYTHPIIYSVRTVPHYLRILQANESGSGGEPREAKYAPQLTLCSWVQTHNFGDSLYDWFRDDKIKNYQAFLPEGKST